jgi:integrase
MNESSLRRVPSPDPTPPRRVRRSSRRVRHARDGQITVRVVTRPGPDGRPVRLQLYGYTIGSGKTRRHRERQEWTAADAQARLDAERQARVTGNVLHPAERTFSQVIDEYLVFKSGVPGTAEGKATIEDDRKILRNRIQRVIGNPPIRQLTALVIARYAKARTEQVRANTIRNELAILRHLLRLAKGWGYIAEMPEVRLPEPGESRERYLEEADIARLFAACLESRNPHLATIVALAVNTGLRKGNLLRLTWDQIDLSTARITIPRRKSPRRKTRRPHSLPISPAVYDILIRHTPTAAQRTGYLFARRDGAFWGQIRRAFEGAVDRAQITDFTFHDLRHTAASHLIKNGATLQEVQEILGHSDIKLTLRYAHLNPGQLRTAVARINFRLPTVGTAPSPVERTDKRTDSMVAVDTLPGNSAESLHAPVAQLDRARVS